MTDTQTVFNLDINNLEPNPLQPRGLIDPKTLGDLVESIKQHGILEPLVAAKTPAGLQIIAGERRWRAAKILQLKTVPVIIKETTPKGMLEMAIVENVQREDLNPIERGKAFLQLKDEFGLSYEEVSTRIGKSIPYVINSIRLLALPDALKDGLLTGLISEGHGRALAGIPNTRLMIEAYKMVLKEKASVRRAEDIARRMKAKIEEGTTPVNKENLAQFVRSRFDPVSQNIRSLFNETTTKVKISQSNVATKVIIQFNGPPTTSSIELKKLYKILCKEDLPTN